MGGMGRDGKEMGMEGEEEREREWDGTETYDRHGGKNGGDGKGMDTLGKRRDEIEEKGLE